jgi:hypothetical protein
MNFAPVEDIAEAHCFLESGKQIGKVVVTLYRLIHAGVH